LLLVLLLLRRLLLLRAAVRALANSGVGYHSCGGGDWCVTNVVLHGGALCSERANEIDEYVTMGLLMQVNLHSSTKIQPLVSTRHHSLLDQNYSGRCVRTARSSTEASESSPLCTCVCLLVCVSVCAVGQIRVGGVTAAAVRISNRDRGPPHEVPAGPHYCAVLRAAGAVLQAR
jgi:hypothetical protein